MAQRAGFRKMETSIFALMWDNPNLGQRIGIATIEGYNVEGNYKQETIPVYKNGYIYVSGYNSFKGTIITGKSITSIVSVS